MFLFMWFQNFSPNPYFDDTKLTKTFTFLDEGTTKITATPIKWKEGKVILFLLITFINKYFWFSSLILGHSVFYRVFPMEIHMRKMEISVLMRRTGFTFSFSYFLYFHKFWRDDIKDMVYLELILVICVITCPF